MNSSVTLEPTKRSATFEEIEGIRCPKCASGPNCKCWVMAGRGITTKTKLVPHIERAITYFDNGGAE